MFIKLWNWFVKITAWPVQKIILNIQFAFQNREKQSRRISGPAIIVSNHTSVYDYAALLFTFFGRTLRVQMAEVLFEKRLLGVFLKMLGGIRIDRDAYSINGLDASMRVLNKGGIVGIFPEGRLPRPGEDRPLEFREGAAYLALASGVPVIPVHISGKYFSKERICVCIGEPIDLRGEVPSSADEREAIREGSRILREHVIELGKGKNHEA